MEARRIVLAARPRGEVLPEHFRLEQVALDAPGPGQVLVRNHLLSLDPYMRGRMSEAKSYAAPQPLDATMIGATAGEVLLSNDPRFRPGDMVTGMLGWCEAAVAEGDALTPVSVTDRISLSAHLGVLGMPGVTAWYGVQRLLEPQGGETVLVSAASGAVGSIAGQLARRAGAHVIGIAGGPEKCRYVVEELGFAACVDHKAGNLAADLKAATPDGIDCLFENVGGPCLDAALPRMNAHGHIALCGLIAGYNGEDASIRNLRYMLTSRLTVQGFIITEHPTVWPQAQAELAALVEHGSLHWRESIATGLESAPEAFIGLLKGRNLGKQLVRL
jgi:hypothetical protein